VDTQPQLVSLRIATDVLLTSERVGNPTFRLSCRNRAAGGVEPTLWYRNGLTLSSTAPFCVETHTEQLPSISSTAHTRMCACRLHTVSVEGIPMERKERRNIRQRAAVLQSVVSSVVENPSVTLSVEILQTWLNVPRDAASRMLSKLVSSGLVREMKRGVFVRGTLQPSWR
jgi:hypothetical protein